MEGKKASRPIIKRSSYSKEPRRGEFLNVVHERVPGGGMSIFSGSGLHPLSAQY